MWENGTKRLLWSMVENRYLKKSLGHRRSRLVYYALPDPITLSYNVNLILFYVTHGFNPAFPNSLSAALLKIYCMLSIYINIKFCRNIFSLIFEQRELCTAYSSARHELESLACNPRYGAELTGDVATVKPWLELTTLAKVTSWRSSYPLPSLVPLPPTYGRCRTVVGPLCSTRRGERREGCKYGLESKPLNNLEDVK